MPIEATMESPVEICPSCDDEHDYWFLYGQVQRSRRPLWRPWRTRPYVALICPRTKDVVGYHDPFTGEVEIEL